MIYKFILDGPPIPLQRARCGRQQKVYDSQKNHKLVAGINLKNQFEQQDLLEGILKLDAIFYMPIPQKCAKKYYGTFDKNLHYKKPDLDNLIKFICDVANGIVYTDDSRIAIIQTEKRYDHNPRTEFTITLLEPL